MDRELSYMFVAASVWGLQSMADQRRAVKPGVFTRSRRLTRKRRDIKALAAGKVIECGARPGADRKNVVEHAVLTTRRPAFKAR